MASPWHIRQAVHALRHGGVIAYPTETVYGLGCDPLDAEAVSKLLELKQRPMEKGLILIGARLEQLLPYLDLTEPALRNKLQDQQPHPITWIAPARSDVPYWLRGRHDTLAVRITTHPDARALCNRFDGALVSTSANPAGLPPALNALGVHRYFNDQLDYLLHTGAHGTNKPSEIRALSDDSILRL